MPSPEETVKAFVKVAPSATYAFDGDRGAESAQLCRRRQGGGEDCIQVAMAAKKLFATMQACPGFYRFILALTEIQGMGYFCQLPFDPSQTHMECVPIPKP